MVPRPEYLKSDFPEYPRTYCEPLSFRGEPLLRGRHRIHPYPAMLHPLLVDFLVKQYLSNTRAVILDPFCGSGVTLLQGLTHGHDVVGFDINPIALLISEAKTTAYKEETFRREYDDLKKNILRKGAIDVPPIKNIEIWYDSRVVADLGRIRYVLKRKAYCYSSFFTTCFAWVCRHQSFTRNGEFKRYRMLENKRLCMRNEVIPLFLSHAAAMMEVFLQSALPTKSTRLELRDVETGLPQDLEADLILTSPPYGDSGTTVAYEQYTSFGFEWTNDLTPHFQVARDYYKMSLGNKKDTCPKLAHHDILMDTVGSIDTIDSKRARDVLCFFNDYYRALKNVARSLKPGGHMCFVVGNRTVKNQKIPMDQITAAFMIDLGLTFDSITVRKISNKVMPSQNSPTNITGYKSDTMSMEYIVVCHRNP